MSPKISEMSNGACAGESHTAALCGTSKVLYTPNRGTGTKEASPHFSVKPRGRDKPPGHHKQQLIQAITADSTQPPPHTPATRPLV